MHSTHSRSSLPAGVCRAVSVVARGRNTATRQLEEPNGDGGPQRAKIGPDKAKVQQGEGARHLVVPRVSEADLGALQPRPVSVVDMDSLFRQDFAHGAQRMGDRVI